MAFLPGLNSKTSCGRCGAYSHGTHKYIANTTLGLNTCVANGLSLHTFGNPSYLIGEPATGWQIHTTVIDRSWTGMALRCESEGMTSAFRLDYRTTLPGPLYTLEGTAFGWDWSVPASPGSIEILPTRERRENTGTHSGMGQIFAACTDGAPVLFIASQSIARLETISWEHWRFAFEEPGARLMIVPLLSKKDVPRTNELCARWIQLVTNPPCYCEEQFSRSDELIAIRSTFTDPDANVTPLAPLPTIAAVAGESRGLQTLPATNELLETVHGVYAVTDQAEGYYDRTVNMRWIRARIEPMCSSISEDELPFELAYAGDQSWDESTVMDIMLSWRLWGQRWRVLPESMKQTLLQRVSLPEAAAFDAILMERTEPVTGRSWLMDRTIFSHHNQPSEASYDVDWYSGLTLSGLRRACECGDETIESKARALAAAVRTSRSSMAAYYEIFNDWALGVSWTDARAELFNFDCGHNGLEGILAEAKFRAWEEDADGAAFMEYLAARAAPIFCLQRLAHGIKNPSDEKVYGVQYLDEWFLGGGVTQTMRAPYNHAGDFPEFAALLRLHGPVDTIAQQAKDYQADGARYRDWLAFYVGEEPARKLRAKEAVEGNQEVREQASVFYSVAPDTAMRLWVLDQDPKAVQALYTEPMPLVERILCEARYKLVIDTA